jgi:S-adenosylmethionine decarboxylase
MTTPENVGIHIFMNVYDIFNESLLTRLDTGKPLCDSIINALDLHVVGVVSHQFVPHGYTLLYLLSESHFSIHTYPEYHSCYIDIFCCNKHFNSEKAIEMVRTLFQTSNVQHQIIIR